MPHSHDGRAVREPLTLEFGRQLLCRLFCGLGRNGAEHGGIHLVQQVNGPGRKGIALAAPKLPADITVHVVCIKTDTIEHYPRRFHDLLADAITR